MTHTDKPVFCLFPRAVMRAPAPGWKPIDFATASALIVAARLQLADTHHRMALESGAAATEMQREFDREYRESATAAKRNRRAGLPGGKAMPRSYVYKVGEDYGDGSNAKERLRRASAHGYRRAMRRLRKQPPPKEITVKLSINQILDLAGLSQHGRSTAAVKAALVRLQTLTPSGMDTALVQWTRYRISSGAISISISGEWLNPPLMPIPMQLPTRSLPAIRLLLFILNVDTSRHNKTDIHIDDLYERLGISLQRRRSARYRALRRAFDVVNDYFETLDVPALGKQKIEVPAKCRIEIEDRRARIVTVRAQAPDDDGESYDGPGLVDHSQPDVISPRDRDVADLLEEYPETFDFIRSLNPLQLTELKARLTIQGRRRLEDSIQRQDDPK